MTFEEMETKYKAGPYKLPSDKMKRAETLEWDEILEEKDTTYSLFATSDTESNKPSIIF